jgi:WS/DGAT C-terminal domain
MRRLKGRAWAKRAASTHINLYITNVPGPASTLYFAGARLLQVAPLAPLVAGVRLSVTALSYDGQFAVSLLADDNMPVCLFSQRAYGRRLNATSLGRGSTR